MGPTDCRRARVGRRRRTWGSRPGHSAADPPSPMAGDTATTLSATPTRLPQPHPYGEAVTIDPTASTTAAAAAVVAVASKSVCAAVPAAPQVAQAPLAALTQRTLPRPRGRGANGAARGEPPHS